MELLFVAGILGVIPSMIAANKGRSGFLWWLYGAGLFIIALPHAILIKPERNFEDQRALRDGGKKCPDCAEIVRAEARRCRFCGSELAPASSTTYDRQQGPTMWQRLWWNPHARDR